ncbi:ABC transporter ATP-binding protein, partial [Hominenteromicrobium sp.]|uniref:ABC transporter ATP-binding protein n=1 Tax=Hominenteromicrobium sp. TaxID=3073581 RepID=UPI003A9278DA
MSYCEANDLAVGYNSPLLEHIKFAAERGQILTLIGPNGAGKSTLMKTLAAQLAPQGGTVLLDGQSLSVYSPNARARKMALMVPHTNRTELTTCFDVAAAGRYPYTGRLGILSEEDKKQVFDALHLVNAADIADRDFDKISDGQRQRVLLARAVCQKPEILFLDAPTSFLDVKGKAELLTILRHLAKEKNTAIILSLHELDLAQKLSAAVVCVSPNSVSDIMTVKGAFQKENIQKLYKMSDEEYTFLFGKKEPPKFEHYIRSGQK